MSDQPMRRHPFVPSGKRANGERMCLACGGLESHAYHRDRDQRTSDEWKAAEARRIGEKP